MGVKVALARIYQHAMTAVGGGRIELDRNRDNAVVLLAPDYGNVGDLAIGYAQEAFLRELRRFHVQSVPLGETYRVLRRLRRDLGPNDVVLLVGGGSMGDLYPRAQLGREFVARYLHGQRMVSFPQSIIYRDGPGREASVRREARALTKSARWLTLFARESASLAAMRESFPGRVGYCPDIVLMLASRYQSLPELPRREALIVLRQDGERALSEMQHAAIRRAARTYGPLIDRDHSMPDESLDPKDPYAPALGALEQYRRSAVVVTDRLHGMIFAVVTGTPCVVFPNANHKIAATYHDWIAGQCAFVALVESFDQGALTDALARVTAPQARAGYRDVRFGFEELRQAVLARGQLT